MRKLARHSGKLPSDIFLAGAQKSDEYPVAGGGFSDVFIGTLGGKKVALKVLRILQTDEKKKKVHDAFCQEALTWRYLKHEHILPFLGVSMEVAAPQLCLVSPWMENGNITEFLNKKPEADRLNLVRQLGQALDYLHSLDPQLIHGDIKSFNILINDKEQAYLADLGLITIADSHHVATTFSMNGEGGSKRWMAPELFDDSGKKSPLTDVYALGMTMFEIFTGQLPFAHIVSDTAVMVAALNGERPKMKDTIGGAFQISQRLWYLMESCWSTIREERPEMHQLLLELDRIRHIYTHPIDSDSDNTPPAERTTSTPPTTDALTFSKFIESSNGSSHSGVSPINASWNPKAGCLPGTRVALLDQVSKFMTDIYSPRRIVWLTGLSGSGKSAIAHSVAALCSDKGILGASFFFKYNTPDRSRPEFVLPTLATDLASFHRSLHDFILEDGRKYLSLAALQLQFQHLLLRPLQSAKGLGPVVIIIDALDECGSYEDRQELLSIIAEEFPKLPVNVKLFITSRPEQDICDAFYDETIFHHKAIETSDSGNMSDIRTYVDAQVKRIASVKRRRLAADWPDEARQNLLAERSSGLFIWITTALTIIERSFKPDAELNDLLKTTSVHERAQNALDALYQSALARSLEWTDSRYHKAYQVCVGIVVVAQEPLSLKSVDMICADDVSDIPDFVCLDVFDRLRCILEITDDDVVHVLHPSFSEWVTDSKRCHDPRFMLLPGHHHYRLAQFSLHTLSISLRRNMCDLEDITLINAEIKGLAHILNERLPGYLRYAVKFWVYHLIRCNFLGANANLLLPLLRDHGIHWIEALSMEGYTRNLTASLSSLLKWISVSLRRLPVNLSAYIKLQRASPNTEFLRRVVHDLHQFSSQFASIISMSACHIYTSAVPFVPVDSTLEGFRHLTKNIPQVLVGRTTAWDRVTTLSETVGFVCCMGYSSDGLQLASGDHRGSIKVWSRHLQLPTVPHIDAHDGKITFVWFSPDDRYLLSGSENFEAKIWHASSGRQYHKTIIHKHYVTCGSFGIIDSDTIIATGSLDATVRLWNLTNLELRATMFHEGPGVNCLAFNQDSSRLYSGSDNGNVYCWDTYNGSLYYVFDSKGVTFVDPLIPRTVDSSQQTAESKADRWRGREIQSLTYVPLSDTVVASVSKRNGGDLISRNASTAETINVGDVQKLEAHTLLSQLTVHSSELLITSANSSNLTLLLYDCQGRTAVRRWEIDGYLLCITWCPITREIAIALGGADGGNRIAFYSVDEDKDFAAGGRSASSEDSSISCCRFSDDGNAIVCGRRNGIVEILDLQISDSVWQVTTSDEGEVLSVSFDSIRRLLLVGFDSGAIRMWDTKERRI